MKACTIIARNYLAYARVLADSFLEHNPDASFSVLVVDAQVGGSLGSGERFETLRPTDVGLDMSEFHRMAMIYDVLELATAVKPWLLSHLLRAGEEDVAYFDPDIQVFAPLDDISRLAREHNIVLTPHTTDAMPKKQNELAENTILIAGMYNLGFLALGPGEESNRFLQWWMERVARECLVDPARGRFVDQRWVDFVPSLFEAHILRDPSYNVAWWNLGSREVVWTGNRYEVNGKPLQFFHFSGFRPDKPHLLSFHQGGDPPVLLSEQPTLARISSEYADLLADAGYGTSFSQKYGLSKLPGGIPIDKRVRRLYREALSKAERGEGPEPPEPFDPESSQRFDEWLQEPAETIGLAGKISRYLDSVYAESAELQLRFPDLRWKDADAYLEWVRAEGRWEEKIPLQFVPPPSPEVPESEREDLSTPAEPDYTKLQPGVNVAGYFRAELGIGEAARQLITAISRAKVPFTTLTYAETSSRQEHAFDAEDADEPLYDTNIICVNADQTLSFVHDIGPRFLFHRYSIGLWFWEVAHFPKKLHDAFEAVNEVWVGSDFVRETVAAATSKPVVTFPLGLEMPEVKPKLRSELGLPEGFLFLFAFDFLSVFERKNPLGVIEAFKRAFEPGAGPVLVLKSINGDQRLADLEQLRLAADRPDVVVWDEYISAGDKNALIASCDSYVSLHRSEGFGLTMAEAMALGKPVIATAYAGNLMFMNEENSYLVPYRLAPIPRGCDPYPAGVAWAEPDIEVAAQYMRTVFERADEARAKGERARQHMRDHHSLDGTAAFIRDRLEEIRREKEAPSAPAAAAAAAAGEPEVEKPRALDLASEYLAAGPRNPVSARGKTPLGRMARRLLFRVLRPYTIRHREFEEAVVDGLSELEEELEDARRELRYEVERLDDRLERAAADAKADGSSASTRLDELATRISTLEAKLLNHSGETAPVSSSSTLSS